MIREQIHIIEDTISRALEKSGRKRGDLRIMAVTKTQTPETINEVFQCGIDLIGENKVQELMDKEPFINPDFERHFIGQLQTNKVKYLIGRVSLIHSADRPELLRQINRLSEAAGTPMPVLLQVNISGEQTKAGVSPENLFPLLEECMALPYVKPIGLMTVASLVGDPEDNRRPFAQMRELLETCQRQNADMTQLSMGMSHDYAVAAEEGATILRLGSVIFGDRKYN